MAQILPSCIDNTYVGRKIALWIFGLIVATRSLQGLMVVFNGRSIAQDADGIPLASYAPDAAQTIHALFVISGWSILVLCALCALALIRYRSAVPFMFLLLSIDIAARKAILYFIPIARIGTPPGQLVNLALIALTLLGLFLSLKCRATSTSK